MRREEHTTAYGALLKNAASKDEPGWARRVVHTHACTHASTRTHALTLVHVTAQHLLPVASKTAPNALYV